MNNIGKAIERYSSKYEKNFMTFNQKLSEFSSITADKIIGIVGTGLQGSFNSQKITEAIQELMTKRENEFEQYLQKNGGQLENYMILLKGAEDGDIDYKYISEGIGACDLCDGLNEQIFKIINAKAGINYPPIHPNCKCRVTALKFGSIIGYSHQPEDIVNNLNKLLDNLPYIDKDVERIEQKNNNEDTLSTLAYPDYYTEYGPFYEYPWVKTTPPTEPETMEEDDDIEPFMKIPLEERTKWPYQGYEEDDIVNVLENINKKAVILFSAQNGLVNTGAADQKAGLIVDYKKTPFMSYHKDTDSNSYNVAIREHEYTYTDENRIYRHMKTPGIKSPDDYYIIAMGEGFAWSADKLCEPSSNGMNAGFTFQVQLTTDSGEDIYIDILFGCSKGGEYSYVPHDNVIEFIVDRYPIGNCVVGGNVDLGLLTGNAQGSVGISSISAYKNGNLFDGTYWPKGNWTYEN